MICFLLITPDQKAAPGPSLPAVQFIGQSFAPLPPSSHHSRPSAHNKRPAAAATTTTTGRGEREKEEEEEEGIGQIMPKYPADREPGEGIDSEHIAAFGSPDSKDSRRVGQGGRGQDEERKNRTAGDDATVYDSSAPEIQPALDKTLSCPSQSAGYCEGETPFPSPPGQTASLGPERPAAQGDLQRENDALRSELRDIREELQKRLEDLEGQRRAEAEARTRLKQLGRKHASQAGEREEQERERRREREEEDRVRRAELEQEKAEAERLRKALASLEAKVKPEGEEGRGKGERGVREEEKEGKEQAMEDRESELIELNIQLKKQLAEVKAQLALEREEREREKEEEERKRTKNKGSDLSLKLAELEAELEELKRRGQKEKNILDVSSPLTYLSLHDDDLNTNLVGLDNNKLLPSPEQHRLFCQSANQRNAAVSQATADLIQEEGTGKVLETTLVFLPSEQEEAPADLQRTETAAACCDLAREVERLRGENAREAGRARQCRAKLEALQSQVR